MKEMIIRTLNVGETCCFYYTFRGNAAVESVFYKKNLLVFCKSCVCLVSGMESYFIQDAACLMTVSITYFLFLKAVFH